MKPENFDTGELLSAILNEDLQQVKALIENIKPDDGSLKHIILSEAKYSNTDYIEIPYILASKLSTFDILEYLSSIVGMEEINKVFYLPGGSINALLAAIEYDRLSNVDWLLCNGADASCENASEMGLHKAVRLSNYKLTKLLLQDYKVQCQINIHDSKGQTALHIATKNGHAAIIELLLSYSADPLAFNSDGLCSIHIAALEGHLQVIKLLCDKYQVNPKFPATLERLERNPLHFASIAGNHEIISLLTQTYLVNPNLTDNNLNNALHCCFINPYNSNLLQSLEDYKKAATELIPKISDITAKNKDNLKSEDLARLNGYIFCEEIFVQEVFKESTGQIKVNGSVRRRIKKGGSQRTSNESQNEISNRNSSHLIGVGNLYGFGMASGHVANLNNSDVTKASLSEEINTFPRIKKTNSIVENVPISIVKNKEIQHENNDLDTLVKPTFIESKHNRKNKDSVKNNHLEKNDNINKSENFNSWFVEQTNLLKEQDKAESSFPIAQSTPPPSTKLNEFPFPDKLMKDKKATVFQDSIIETKKAAKKKPPPPPKNFKLSKHKDSESDDKIFVKPIEDIISENKDSINEDEFKPIPKPRKSTILSNSTSSEMQIEIPVPEQKPMSTFSTKDVHTNLNIYKSDVNLINNSEHITKRSEKKFVRTLSKTASIEVPIPNPYEINSKTLIEKTEEKSEISIPNLTENDDPKINHSVLKASNEKFVDENNAHIRSGLVVPIINESEQLQKKTKKSTRFKDDNLKKYEHVHQDKIALSKDSINEIKNETKDEILISNEVRVPKATNRIKITVPPIDTEEKLNDIQVFNEIPEEHFKSKDDSSSLEDSDSLSEGYDSDEITNNNSVNTNHLLTDVKIIEVNRNSEKKFGFSIVGGNSEGIFINTLKNVTTNLLEVGDQIVGVDALSIAGRTREDMYKLLDMYKNSVNLSIVKNNEQYQKIIKTGSGDKFYVRAKFLHDTGKKRELKINEGDVFCVTDSLPDKYEGFWWAQKMQAIKGEEQLGLIPNQSRADQILMKQQLYSNRNGTFFRSFRRAKSVERLTQKKLNESIDSVNTSMMICSYERVVQNQPENSRLVIILGLFGVMVIELLVRDSPELYISLPPNSPIETGDDNEPLNLKLLRSFMDKSDKSLLVMLQPNSIEYLKHKTNFNPIVIYISPVSKLIVKAVKMKLVPNLDKNPSHMYNEAAKFEKNYQNLFTNSIAYTSDDWWFFHLKETINQAQQQPVWITEEEALNTVSKNITKLDAKPKSKARTTDDLHNTSTSSLSRIQTSTFDTQKGINTHQHIPIKDRPGLPIPQKKVAIIPTSITKPEVDETILRTSRPSSKFDQTKFIDQRSSSEEDSVDISSDDDEDLTLKGINNLDVKVAPTNRNHSEVLKGEVKKNSIKNPTMETINIKNDTIKKVEKQTNNIQQIIESRNHGDDNIIYSKVPPRITVNSKDNDTDSKNIKLNKKESTNVFRTENLVNGVSEVQKVDNSTKGNDKSAISGAPKMNIHAKFDKNSATSKINEITKNNSRTPIMLVQPEIKSNISESESETDSEDDSLSEESSEDERPTIKSVPARNFAAKTVPKVQFSNQHSRETPI